MKPFKVTWAPNFTLQRTTGSRCSPLAAERGRYPYKKNEEVRQLTDLETVSA